MNQFSGATSQFPVLAGGGCYLASRLAGLLRAESGNIAIMMNIRALMELIVVNLGYDR